MEKEWGADKPHWAPAGPPVCVSLGRGALASHNYTSSDFVIQLYTLTLTDGKWVSSVRLWPFRKFPCQIKLIKSASFPLISLPYKTGLGWWKGGWGNVGIPLALDYFPLAFSWNLTECLCFHPELFWTSHLAGRNYIFNSSLSSGLP